MQNNEANTEYISSLRRQTGGLTKEERRQKRQQKNVLLATKTSPGANDNESDGRFAELLSKKEDLLLSLVAQINNVYQDKLKKPAPFMTFVLCGMQSSGKSTVMERFMHEVLNIVGEGTGTRCPLDTTCIHDEECQQPICELSGEELDPAKKGNKLSTNEVFAAITSHNHSLGEKDSFSTAPLRLTIRSKRVQNMRFVDTPGIISNRDSSGNDNREDIKKILGSEMTKPNTKLCVLLEPKEFHTNPIINFCDETFGDRKNWISKSTFLMTKFDQKLEDARSGEKANRFFKSFEDNGCFPHLIITPTLAKENLPPAELYERRREVLDSADKYEASRFEAWRQSHRLFCQEQGDDEEDLNKATCERIGFATAKKIMREILLTDTVKRLPEVLASLREDLDACEKEYAILLKKQKFNDPKELKFVVHDVLLLVEEKILGYLDGDLQSAMKFPHELLSLHDEIDEEEDSDWAAKKLNHHTDKEDFWRNRIAAMEGDYPEELQASDRFLGGKQYQRAMEFFRAVMVDALPDPYQLKDKVKNATGYLAGGLQRENWERAMVQIIGVCIKDVSHPGINYLIKHVGLIFRRLFTLALEDIKHGETFSAMFQQLPSAVERHLTAQFDLMLWKVMEHAADQTHRSLEPMYSTVDPNLPTFHTTKFDDDNATQGTFIKQGDQYVKTPSKEEEVKEGYLGAFQRRVAALVSGSGSEAKMFLKEENTSRATKKKFFLPDERTAMITDKETDRILQRSFEYIVGLMEFNLVILKFELNHYLYEGFKNNLKTAFSRSLAEATDWESLVEPDPDVEDRLNVLDKQIAGLRESLQEVQQIQRKIV